MKLIAYLVDGHSIDIRPAPATRDWMDDTNDSFAYRCLPLNIANAHGWEILCPGSFEATWNGAREPGGVTIVPEVEMTTPPYGHFGYGILTFRVNCVFRTEPGYDLFVQGPVNRPKDGIAALSGIIETRLGSLHLHHELAIHARQSSGSLREGRTDLPFLPDPSRQP